MAGRSGRVPLIPTFSPQGDGNPDCERPVPQEILPLIPTFSPQGDGNNVNNHSALLRQ